MALNVQKKYCGSDWQVDVSILRILATIAVILLHTCNTITNNEDSYALTFISRYLLSSVVYVMNWAVPIFFMITGHLLVIKEKAVTYNLVINKYCKRIILALIIFGIPFSMMESYMNTRSISIGTVGIAFVNVLTGNSWGHLWYLYSLIGVYLLLPILWIAYSASRENIRILIGLLFIANFCLPMVNAIFKMNIAFKLPIGSFSIFYVLLGAYLRDCSWIRGLSNQKMGVALVVCLISIFCINYFVPDSEVYLTYNSPIIAIFSVTILELVKRIKFAGSPILKKLDRLCFGVYLIHPVFINFMYKFLKATPMNFGSLFMIGVIIFWVVFCLLSFIVSLLMSMIPALKRHIL